VFHVISVICATLARLARRIDAIRDGSLSEAASWYGWTAVQVSRGTWEYRDPRFTDLAMDRQGLRTGCEHCDDKVRVAIDNRAAEGIASPLVPSWAQTAIAGRIQQLGTVPVWTRVPGTAAFTASGQVLPIVQDRADCGGL
jgi:hypothetical protein